MVALRILSVALVLSQVAASPALIQRLYGAPPEGENVQSHLHSDHHNHHHGAAHGTEAEVAHSAGLQGSVVTVTKSDINPATDVEGLTRVADFSGQSSGVFNSAQIAQGRLGLPASDQSIGSNVNTGSDSSQLVSTSQTLINDATSNVESSGADRILTTEQIANDLFHRNTASGRSNAQLDGSLIGQSNIAAQKIADGLNNVNQDDLTITLEYTRDVYTTYTNVYYNSIPVTLTQFVKSTTVLPTVQIAGTPVDDRVLVSTAPVTKTDTLTVTNTNTVHQFATEVSTDIYTITHRAYDIQQQVVTSTLVQTQVLRSTIVSTVILTEYDTSTERQTVTNTIVVQPKQTATVSPVSGSGSGFNNFDLRFPSVNRVGLADVTSSLGISFEGNLLDALERNQNILVNKQNQLINRVLRFPSENVFLNTLVESLNDLFQSRNLAMAERQLFQVDFYHKQRDMDIQLNSFERSSTLDGSVQQGLLHSDSHKSGHKHGGHGYY